MKRDQQYGINLSTKQNKLTNRALHTSGCSVGTEIHVRLTQFVNMKTISQKLQEAPVGKDDYVGFLEEVLDGVVQIDDADTVFAEAFSFFERNSDADLGMPGPLVHFLEQFYPAYIDQLCSSVTCKPTTYTIWMINRILNGSLETTNREHLLAVLEAASKNSSADSIAKEQASESLRQQLECGSCK